MNKDPGTKQQLFAQLAEVAKALGHANRLELLELLAQGERSVEALARVARLSVANTSQHLRRLARAGLVVGRKDGLRVHYRLADDETVALLSSLRRVAEANVAELGRLIDTRLRPKDSMEPVAPDAVLAGLKAGTVTVVDVRPAEEFAAGHLPGALNIPLAELEARMEELPAGVETIAYCRGAYCVLAFEAVARLREHGRPARRLEDGFPEWKQAGLPVEEG